MKLCRRLRLKSVKAAHHHLQPKGGGGIQNHCMSCRCILQILYHFFNENELYIRKIRHLYSVFIFQVIWHILYHDFNFMNWIKCVRFSKEMKYSQYAQYLRCRYYICFAHAYNGFEQPTPLLVVSLCRRWWCAAPCV